MEYIKKIGLGTVQFGIPYGISNCKGQTSTFEVTKILNLARESGITYIDTASVYGTAEDVLGLNKLNNFRIVSKFMPKEINGSVQVQLDRTLSRLKIDSLYGFLSHRPLNILVDPKQWDELLLLKQNKKIKKIGFSLNDPKELEILLKREIIPDLIQVPYSYFDNRFRDLMAYMKANGCEVHTRSTFLQGIFFSNVDELPKYFDSIKEPIKELQREYSDDLSGFLLKYSLLQDFIDIVIMGVESQKQLVNNLKSICKSGYLPARNFNFSDSILMPSRWPKIN